MYDTGLVLGEDSTTIGEAGSTFLRPGLKAVTDPTITAPVVICVGACCIMPVCLTTEVFATGCPNASGAIIAQTKTIVIRLMGVPFIELTFRSCFVRRAFFGCLMGRVRALRAANAWFSLNFSYSRFRRRFFGKITSHLS
jgi:hypothetical protein